MVKQGGETTQKRGGKGREVGMVGSFCREGLGDT